MTAQTSALSSSSPISSRLIFPSSSTTIELYIFVRCPAWFASMESSETDKNELILAQLRTDKQEKRGSEKSQEKQ